MSRSASPLFKTAGRQLQALALRQFKSSPIGRAFSEIQRITTSPLATPAKLSRVLSQVKSLSPKQMVSKAMGTGFGQLSSTVMKYQKGNAEEREVIKQFLEALGPAGDVIKALSSPSWQGSTEKTRTLHQMVDLIQKLGMEVLPSPAAAKMSPATLNRSVEAAVEFLRQTRPELLAETLQAEAQPVKTQREKRREQAQRLRERERQEERRPGVPEDLDPYTAAGKPRKRFNVPRSTGGPTMHVPAGHPLITGNMVRAVGSSNVHSYGYDYDSAFLYVRFLGVGKGGIREGRGPLYRYSNVEPEKFIALHNSTSKGTWIWDDLRIRGTVSGHQKDYALVGITGNYVPRKATINARGEEVFQKRRIKTTKNRWLESRETELAPVSLSGVNRRWQGMGQLG
tara:strand:+ start:2705 stop:3898 length:1194 start_codon:yes stop_codon:yes gene_type:complete